MGWGEDPYTGRDSDTLQLAQKPARGVRSERNVNL